MVDGNTDSCTTPDDVTDEGRTIEGVEVTFRPQQSREDGVFNNNSSDDSTDNETNFESVVEKIEDRRSELFIIFIYTLLTFRCAPDSR